MAIKAFNTSLQKAAEAIEANRVEQQRKIDAEAKYNLYQQAMSLNEQWNLGIAENTLYINLLAEKVSAANARVYYDKIVKMAAEKKAKYSVPTSDYPLTSATSEDDGSIWLWLLIPIAAIAIGKIFGTNNKRKK